MWITNVKCRERLSAGMESNRMFTGETQTTLYCDVTDICCLPDTCTTNILFVESCHSVECFKRNARLDMTKILFSKREYDLSQGQVNKIRYSSPRIFFIFLILCTNSLHNWAIFTKPTKLRGLRKYGQRVTVSQLPCLKKVPVVGIPMGY
jgi:hypothetical protein